MVAIDADAGGVAADLRAIDPGLKVRFAENGNPPFWAVYHESEDGRNTYLVLTAVAHMTPLGTWGGLDQRIVKRIQEIDPQGRGGYDFASEVQKQDAEARERHRQRFRDRVGETGEKAIYAIRKDLGSKSRAFKPRDTGGRAA